MPSTQNGVRRLRLAGEQVEVADDGDGEPVLFLHGGVFSDWFTPVAAQPRLARLRRIRMRRAGYLPGVAPTRPLSIADHARLCALLLEAVGLRSAHVCGHSAGALTAIQLALDAPQCVRSLILLEPAPAGDLATPDEMAAIGPLLGPAFGAVAAGDLDTGFDSFLAAVGGPGARELVEQQLGRDGLAVAVQQTVSLSYESQAVADWRFSAADAARIGQPMLLVDGGRSDEAPFAPRTVQALAAMVPEAEVITLPGVTHLMSLQDPAAIADLIAHFIAETGASGGNSATTS
jgi:pimeloyl-ACP methyl ester carboxylesterase